MNGRGGEERGKGKRQEMEGREGEREGVKKANNKEGE